MYIWIHDKYSSTASNSDYGREKLFSYDKINVSNHVCHCGAEVKELLARADKPGSPPGDDVFCFFVPFFFLPVFFFFLTVFFPVLFYYSLFFILLLFFYSYCWPCWSCTWINIYLKLKSGVLFWQRDFKSSWYAYWPSLRPDKNHKLSSHVPPLKQLNFFQC